MDIFFSRLNIRQFISLMLIGIVSYLATRYLPATISYWLLLGAISAISFNNSKQKHLAFLCFWLVTFVIIGVSQNFSIHDNIYRGLLLLSGYVLIMLTMLDFPKRYRQQQIRLTIDNMLRSLNQLCADIFACFTVQYADNIYLYERRLHAQKLKYIHLVEQLRSYREEEPIVNAANAIFESLIDCSQLRWRVTDAATFELCQQEMSALQRAIAASFAMLIKINIKQTNYPLVAVDEQIDALEATYQSVLQIAAKEPFVFLLFIASARRMQNAIHSFYGKDQPHVE